MCVEFGWLLLSICRKEKQNVTSYMVQKQPSTPVHQWPPPPFILSQKDALAWWRGAWRYSSQLRLGKINKLTAQGKSFLPEHMSGSYLFLLWKVSIKVKLIAWRFCQPKQTAADYKNSVLSHTHKITHNFQSPLDMYSKSESGAVQWWREEAYGWCVDVAKHAQIYLTEFEYHLHESPTHTHTHTLSLHDLSWASFIPRIF